MGGVEIPIKVNTHLGKYDSFEAEGNIDVTGGVNAAYDLEAAVEWTPGGVTKSYTGTPQFNVYPLTVEAQATAEAKVSFYPRIEIGIYKFLGPWLEPRPYLKEEIEAGLAISSDGNENYGWTATLYNGLDLRTGFDLTFCGLTANVWTSEIYNVVKDSELFEAPKRIRKLTPNDNIELKNGESVKVEFIVESYCPINKKYYPCPLALVNFEPDCGEVDKEIAVADANGKVCVEWTPKPATTRAEEMVKRELKAKLVDKDCNTIDEAIFIVGVEDAVIEVCIDEISIIAEEISSDGAFIYCITKAIFQTSTELNTIPDLLVDSYKSTIVESEFNNTYNGQMVLYKSKIPLDLDDLSSGAINEITIRKNVNLQISDSTEIDYFLDFKNPLVIADLTLVCDPFLVNEIFPDDEGITLNNGEITRYYSSNTLVPDDWISNIKLIDKMCDIDGGNIIYYELDDHDHTEQCETITKHVCLSSQISQILYDNQRNQYYMETYDYEDEYPSSCMGIQYCHHYFQIEITLKNGIKLQSEDLRICYGFHDCDDVL